MSDKTLMQFVKTEWGAVIDSSCSGSALPAAFVAALIAGESGGNVNAKRFEKNVLAALWEVLVGRKAAYGRISHAALLAHLWTDYNPPFLLEEFSDALQRLDALATSWGLTQIMGYHVLDPDLIPQPPDGSPTTLGINAPLSLQYTIALLEGFAKEFTIDERREFDKLFRCWNTGRPDGATFDPAYVNNGLARMAIWTSLP